MQNRERLFLAAVLVAALVYAGASLSYTREALHAPEELPTFPATGAGQTRAINVDRFRQLIRQGDLSDHEAEYYRQMPE